MSQSTAGASSGKPKVRPKYLDLRELSLSQPIPAVVSIMHRISGAALFLFLPFLLCMLERKVFMGTTLASLGVFARLLLLALLFAYVYHFCAGIRFLLLDKHIGVEREASRLSAKIVLGASVVLTLLIGVKVW
ncbi:MAG: succinate dehydrogenase, cytochrome b556 subunit [Rhodocyclaceae bacterium]|nr:succinate dehydrogenase, cytochrome b556 subunit [Rhodocyclaceae bacterium]